MAFMHFQTDAADEAARAKGKTIGFDDLDLTAIGGTGEIEDGYMMFNWFNMFAANPEDANLDQYGRGGFFTGVTSGHQVAYNAGGKPAGFYLDRGTFSLNSVQATAAWDKKLTVEIYAFDKHGNQIFDQIFELNDKKPTLLQLNIEGAAEIDFSPRMGTHDPKLDGYGEHIVFDDFVFSKIRTNSSNSSDQQHGPTVQHTGPLTDTSAETGHVFGNNELIQWVHPLA